MSSSSSSNNYTSSSSSSSLDYSSSSSSLNYSSSSSSSLNYSSSSSSSSLNYSSSSSSSSSIDSSSSSSSSSLGYSSSSSSSLWDRHSSRLLPFNIEYYKTNPAFDITYYGNFSFLGTGSDGNILRSSDGYHWGVYYKTDDVFVSSVYVDGKYLYAGTSPNGKCYRFDLTDDSIKEYLIGSPIIGFSSFNGFVFMATNNGDIYIYNAVLDRWILNYTAYNEIQMIYSIDNVMYVAVKGENIITYDGSNWNYLNTGIENFSSIRNFDVDFSFVDHTPLNRETIISSDGDDQIFEVYPRNRSLGISCIEKDGSSLLFGSLNKGRVYRYVNNQLRVLFDTDAYPVYSILNIDSGVNLASIGNKLYLLYSGLLPETPSGIETVDVSSVQNDSVDLNAGKNFVITYPTEGEQFENGQDLTIQWSSKRNQNDAVKLSLYKGGQELRIISAKTSNDGSFDWTIPFALGQGADYQIQIEWLSLEVDENDKAISDGFFSVALTTTTTTTTTTPEPSVQSTEETSCHGIPILVLSEDEYITKISKNTKINTIILLTSNGRVIETKESVINGYLTGKRNIFATVRNGMNFSNTASTDFLYALYNRIVEVNQEKEIVKWKYVKKPSAIFVENTSGIFISPVLYIQEQIGAWKTLIWSENKDEDTDVIVSVKTAYSEDELVNTNWRYSYRSNGEVGNITRDLSDVNLVGQYAQIKVEMKSNGNLTPSVANVALIYSTKSSSYFFTTLFSLKQGSNINKGMLVAEINKPINTEVQIGICDKESSDWNDYRIVPLDKFFDISKFEDIKVGIKLATHDDIHVASVSNFAMFCSGDEINEINND